MQPCNANRTYRNCQTWLCLLLTAAGIWIGQGVRPATASESIVVAPGSALNAAMLEDLVRSGLRSPSDGTWAVKIVEPHLPLANPTAQAVVVEVLSDHGADINPDAAVARLVGWLKVVESQGKSARVPFEAELRAMVTIPVPRRPIPAGTALDPALLIQVAWPKSRVDEAFVQSVDDIGAFEVARRLPAGRPILRSMLQAPRLVHQGERVMITFQRGELRLTMAGRALENAARGDLVRVANPNSGREVQGRITSAGEVLIGHSQ